MALPSDIRIRHLPIVAFLISWIATLSAGLPMARGGEVAVAWSPPLDASDVSSYVVRYGTVSGHYLASTNVGARTSALFKDLPGGLTYYFSAVSLTAAGDESVASNEISVEVPGPPPQPTGAQNVSFAQNTTSPPYPFWLAGLNGSTNWVLLAQSSDTTLIAADGILLSGTGSNRFVRLTPQPDRRGTSVVTLLATDFTVTNSTSFRAEVTPTNLPPLVDAGAGTTVRTNLNYMLRGRASDDGLPRTPGRLTLRWSKVTGPGAVTFGNSNYAVTSVRLGAPGLYRLRLSASDGELTSSSDTIIRALLLSDVTPPVISNFTITEVTPTSIGVTWTTDELADEQVKYVIGDMVPKFSFLNATPRTNHGVTLTNLTPDTSYTLSGRSRDSSGNQAFSDPVTVRTLNEVLVSSPVRSSFQRASAELDSTLEVTEANQGEQSQNLRSDLRITIRIGTGWNLISCPLTVQGPTLASLLPDPPKGTFFLKLNAPTGESTTNLFNGEEWLEPLMVIQAGEGGFLYNPGVPYSWTVQGNAAPNPTSSTLTLNRTTQGGPQFLGLATPYAGLLTSALPGFPFREGDQVRRLRVDTGTYESSRYDGQRWDVVPVINIGEGIFLDLAPSIEGTQ